MVAKEEVEEDLEERVEEAEVLVGLECVEPEGESLLPDLSYDREGVRGVIPETNEIVTHICSCRNIFPLSSVEIIIIPACCVLCVL